MVACAVAVVACWISSAAGGGSVCGADATGDPSAAGDPRAWLDLSHNMTGQENQFCRVHQALRRESDSAEALLGILLRARQMSGTKTDGHPSNRCHTRWAVCRCFRGSDRSASNQVRTVASHGPDTGRCRSGTFRSGGTASASAARTVRRCTRCRDARLPDRQLFIPMITSDTFELLHSRSLLQALSSSGSPWC